MPTLSFIKGGAESLPSRDGVEFDWEKATSFVRDQLSEALNARHVAFLLGSGTSSFIKDKKQVGVPTMLPLAKEFAGTIAKRRDCLFSNLTERKILLDSLGLDMQADEYAGNLERLMEVLHSQRFALSKSKHQRHAKARATVKAVIAKIQRFLLEPEKVAGLSIGAAATEPFSDMEVGAEAPAPSPDRCIELGYSMRDLDKLARTGKYFQTGAWWAHGEVSLGCLAMAAEALGGELTVTWREYGASP